MLSVQTPSILIWHRVAVASARAWDEETAAGDLFVQLNGGSWESVDGVNAPDSTYDIKCTLPNGRTVALEVTQDTTEAIRRQRAIQTRLDWSSDNLDAQWEIAIAEACDVRALHDVIFDLIAEFDATGQRSLVVGRRTPTGPFVDRLRALGVRLIHRVGDATPGFVNLSPASQGGSTGPSVLAEVVQDHANRPDNAKKLSIDSTDERHLWIWVTHDRGEQIAALFGDRAPADAPEVPNTVDAAWIATADTNPIVWSWVRNVGWRSHGTISPLPSPVTGAP